MAWWGKGIGGAVGFLLGGPLGAAAGAALGHYLVDAEEEARAVDPAERRRLVFFVAVFSMLGKLAKADGVVSREEIRAVDRFMREDLELEGEGLEFARNVFREAKDSAQPFQAYARQFAAEFSDETEILTHCLRILLDVALSDGRLDPREDRLLREAAVIFGLGEAQYEHMKGGETGAPPTSSSGSELEQAYRLLGVEPSAPDAQVKRAYRVKAKQYHPDVIASKGLPPEFLELANRKFQELQEAYERIARSRGMD